MSGDVEDEGQYTSGTWTLVHYGMHVSHVVTVYSSVADSYISDSTVNISAIA